MSARCDDGEENEREWQTCDHEDHGDGRELDVSVYAVDIRPERVDALYDCGDARCQDEHHQHVERGEGGLERLSQSREYGKTESLGEDQVDDEGDEDTGVAEDVRCDGDSHVRFSCRPYDPHHAGCYACHIVAEQHAREPESVAPARVGYEEGHVTDGPEDEEDDEDGADWDVDGYGGYTADVGGG